MIWKCNFIAVLDLKSIFSLVYIQLNSQLHTFVCSYPSKLTKDVNYFTSPWMMPKFLIINVSGLKLRPFWENVDQFSTSGIMDHMPRGMTPVIVVMIFRVKIRKDLANDVLSGMFHEDQRQIEEIFELACTYQFMFGCDIPRLWTSDPDEASKNKAYAAINASLDPYHDEIRKAMPVSLSIISVFSLG